MQKLIGAILALLLVAPPLYAATDNIPSGMVHKAVRGGVNMVTGVVEIPMQIYKGYDKGFGLIKNNVGSKTVGTILGFFRGIGHAAGRVGWGGLELVGFWMANPADNEGVGIPFDAEYPWQMGEQYDLFKPSLAEGVKPIGRKLLHGFSDGLLGIAELPGQTLKGAREGNVLAGLGKGFWFWWSREIYGFGSVYTCLVPNPPDNPGYPMNGTWAWSALVE
ncbi:MAG: hypothetical protein COW12_09635 [Candidatus Omnitrophica bacterium CG12_big_fil_rev_8_21_14_0_65_45_16]|nr:MAG: hypothetical protein COW12_09635 [Candidatus Omnitrophica bacterium CG12_big_fil_rev_8_21_14_0_65_45_16]